MPTLSILRQVVEDLAGAFPELVAWKSIYLAPKIMSLPSATPFELQVCDAGVNYTDHDGQVRRELFNLDVGILRRYALDSSGRHAVALSDVTRSIFLTKQKIIEALDRSFLSGDLLIRPLIIVRESPVTEDIPKVLVKKLTFVGGLNVERTE